MFRKKNQNKPKSLSQWLYIILVLSLTILLGLSLIPSFSSYLSFLSPPIVLLIGLIFALVFGRVYPKQNSKISKQLLQYSIIGLGFGMNVTSALASGREGMTFTILSVFGTLIVGMLIARYIFNIDTNIAYLISSGTAICGGSAIAAVSPVIKAKDEQISVALASIFILNALALFIFPSIGRYLNMSEGSLWHVGGDAIHDTSSVIGAGSSYGEERH